MTQENSLSTELFELANDVLTHLPREIRNIVYTHIFDDATLDQVAACSQPSLSQFPYNNLSSRHTQRPPFIRVDCVPREFAIEVVQQFYLSYKSMEVFTPKAIGKYLETDFLGLNIKPIDVPLSAFTISADLDASAVDGIDILTVAADCQPMLNKANQNWRAFQLNITLATRIGFFSWGTPEHVEGLTKKLLAVLSSLRPVLKAAELKGAKVVIKIESYDGWDLQVKYNMEQDENWWGMRVKALMYGSRFNESGIDSTDITELADMDSDEGEA